MEQVNVGSYIRTNHIDLIKGIFVLDNDNQPYSFKVVFRLSREVREIEKDCESEEKRNYFEDVRAGVDGVKTGTAHVMAVVAELIDEGSTGPWVLQLKRQDPKHGRITQFAVIKKLKGKEATEYGVELLHSGEGFTNDAKDFVKLNLEKLESSVEFCQNYDRALAAEDMR